MSTSGWCAEFGRGHHSSCRAVVCACPCHVGETPPIRTVNVDGFGGGVRDNGGSSKDGPGDSLRKQRAEVPGPRPTLQRSAEL